jgi:hypothetical protein
MGPNLRAIKINVDGSPPIVFELDEKHKIKMPEPHQSPDHHLFGQIRAAAGVGDPGPVAGPIVPQTELHDPAIEPPIPEEGTNPEPGFVDNR